MDIDILARVSIAPVIELNDIKHAMLLDTELIDGSVKTLKIALRASVFLRVIQTIRNKLSEYIAGIEGADFAMICGISSKLITAALKISIPYICICPMPAIKIPSELSLGVQHSFLLIEFAPAILNSGMKTLRSFFSMFPEMRFCPTISINQENMQDYFSLKVVCIEDS